MMSRSNDAIPSWMNAWADGMPSFMRPMIPGWHDVSKAEVTESPIQALFDASCHMAGAGVHREVDCAGEEGHAPDVMTPEALLAINSPARWNGPGADAFEPACARCWKVPSTPPCGARAANCSTERDKAVRAYQDIEQKAWNKAFVRFAASFAEKGGVPTRWRGLAERWLACGRRHAHRGTPHGRVRAGAEPQYYGLPSKTAAILATRADGRARSLAERMLRRRQPESRGERQGEGCAVLVSAHQTSDTRCRKVRIGPPPNPRRQGRR